MQTIKLPIFEKSPSAILQILTDNQISYDRILTCGDESYLEADGDLLTLVSVESKKTQRIAFDWNSAWEYHQKASYQLKNEPLAKALGLSPSKITKVIDATCGTGQDAMLMLAFGATLTAFEKDPLVFALLLSAQKRAGEKLGETLLNRFVLLFGDSLETKMTADVFYFDPMYKKSEKKKSALPRLEMQVFHHVLTAEDECETKITKALQLAPRLVIKRPIKAPPYANAKPHAAYKGKSTRYDLYFRQNWRQQSSKA